MLVCNQPEDIDILRMTTLLKALELEILGLHRRGQSAYALIKAEYGLRGNKESVRDQFRALINQRKEGAQ